MGTIIPIDSRQESFAFQYDRKFLKSGIEISPLMMPLRREPYAFTDLPRSEYAGLPPAFSDSLPDAFGRGLIDRWLEGKGYARSEITAKVVVAAGEHFSDGPIRLKSNVELHLEEGAKIVFSDDPAHPEQSTAVLV